MKQLLGEWKITKKYYNSFGEEFMTSKGHATVKTKSDDADCWVLSEEVNQGKPFGMRGKAFKKYFFKIKDNTITQYGVNRLLNTEEEYKMYNLVFNKVGTTSIAVGSYDCGQDNYKGTISIYEDGTFWIRYDVTGPKKNYSVVTEYE